MDHLPGGSSQARNAASERGSVHPGNAQRRTGASRSTERQLLEAVPTDQLGLRQLGETPQLCELDLIFVHGLGAIPAFTWKAKGAQESWLEDKAMLRKKFPTTRILRFGYDSIWRGSNPVRTSVKEVAVHLLEDIYNARLECPTRPFIMIGHCLGGLVIQKSFLMDPLIRQSLVLKACVGVILLGTPNRGTSTFDTHGSLLAAIAAASTISDEQASINIEPKVLQDLRNLEGVLSDTSMDFSRLRNSRELKVVCFYEERASPVSRLVEGSKIPPEFIVDQRSANLEGCAEYGLPLNHFQLNKFKDPNDGNYRAIIRELSNIARKAIPTITIDQTVDVEAPPPFTNLFRHRLSTFTTIQREEVWMLLVFALLNPKDIYLEEVFVLLEFQPHGSDPPGLATYMAADRRSDMSYNEQAMKSRVKILSGGLLKVKHNRQTREPGSNWDRDFCAPLSFVNEEARIYFGSFTWVKLLSLPRFEHVDSREDLFAMGLLDVLTSCLSYLNYLSAPIILDRSNPTSSNSDREGSSEPILRSFERTLGVSRSAQSAILNFMRFYILLLQYPEEPFASRAKTLWDHESSGLLEPDFFMLMFDGDVAAELLYMAVYLNRSDLVSKTKTIFEPELKNAYRRSRFDQDFYGLSDLPPVHLAAQKGSKEVLEILLRRPGFQKSLIQNDIRGFTPFIHSVFSGRLKTIDLLLKHMESFPEYLLTRSFIHDPEYLLTRSSIHDPGIKLRSTPAIDWPDKTGRTALSHAAELGMVNIVTALLQRGANVNSRDDNRKKALSWACGSGSTRALKTAVKLMQEPKTHFDSMDNTGATPLVYAIRSGNADIVDKLLNHAVNTTRSASDYGSSSFMECLDLAKSALSLFSHRLVSLERKDRSGRTPLSWACACRYPEAGRIVRQLLLKGAPINDPDEQLRTPLSYAAEVGNAEVVSELLARDDIQTNREDRDRRTPYDRATLAGYGEIAEAIAARRRPRARR